MDLGEVLDIGALVRLGIGQHQPQRARAEGELEAQAIPRRKDPVVLALILGRGGLAAKCALRNGGCEASGLGPPPAYVMCVIYQVGDCGYQFGSTNTLGRSSPPSISHAFHVLDGAAPLNGGADAKVVRFPVHAFPGGRQANDAAAVALALLRRLRLRPVILEERLACGVPRGGLCM